MKILCLIDSLDSGGAQRQICTLAGMLKQRDHDVSMLLYYPYDFYHGLLDSAMIPVKVVTTRTKPGRIWAIRRAIRQADPDIVIAYMETPAILAELAGLPWRRFRLIASERNTDQVLTGAFKVRMHLHRLADAVVPNSFTQTNLIKQAAPWLASRTETIVNCVDTGVFSPGPDIPADGQIRLLVVSSFKPQKNPLAMVEAMDIIHNRMGRHDISVDWYGNKMFVGGKPTSQSALYLDAVEQIRAKGLSECYRLHDPVTDVTPLYRACTAMCLPSLFEGCPNVVGEAMACGKPVLTSRVCDNPLLVREGENGMLFDPLSPEDIAGAIVRFARLGPEKWRQMGQTSRRIAEERLSPTVFVDKYVELIDRLCHRGRK